MCHSCKWYQWRLDYLGDVEPGYGTYCDDKCADIYDEKCDNEWLEDVILVYI
jgi:hypothetical protein